MQYFKNNIYFDKSSITINLINSHRYSQHFENYNFNKITNFHNFISYLYLHFRQNSKHLCLRIFFFFQNSENEQQITNIFNRDSLNRKLDYFDLKKVSDLVWFFLLSYPIFLDFISLIVSNFIHCWVLSSTSTVSLAFKCTFSITVSVHLQLSG